MVGYVEFADRIPPAKYKRARYVSQRAPSFSRPAPCPSISGISFGGVADPEAAAQTPRDTEAPDGIDVSGNESKRRKVHSFFHHERTEALDPSLLEPTSPLEQANNIFYAQDIGKQYQLAVKDFNIEVRDNRIRAKDKEISELSGKLEWKELQLSTALTRIDDLRLDVTVRGVELQLSKYKNDGLKEKKSTLERDLESANATIMNNDVSLRAMHRDLELSKVEIQHYKNQRLIGYLLRCMRNLLGMPDVIQDTSNIFPLMKLPGELRNRVYKLALVLHHPIDFWPMPSGLAAETSRRDTVEQDLKQISGNLLRVSRQVHKETVPILYGCNRFRFSHLGSWTVLHGFLAHINTNCQYLSSISIKIPDTWTRVIGDEPLQLPERLLNDADLHAVLRRFGYNSIQTPAGPSIKSHRAFSRGCEMLVSLPSLRSFTIVIPHNEEIYKPAAQYIANILTAEDRALVLDGQPASTPKRMFVFLRRPADSPQVVATRNLDDDVAMGRRKLMSAIQGAEIKSGCYRTMEGRVSYAVDGGEDEYDYDVPEYYIEQQGPEGFVLFRPLRAAAKRLLGC
ncbi:hypothetical protein K504DRAFT_467186 [Pleomassaria siparia CBS 279.74]|uniref:Uncharacterized protein n=1 Tax=Pleomassaria siparia CBS 279.74 TaxID=1314801 RepID=A0A6G1K8V7_9PLEO|nr:hypothetical protein K504DRAFT_467186 [Pleomassaria siparia CBS 279.74]